MGTIVTYTYNDGVATISMDDGKANVLSHTMWEELEAAFDQAEKSGAIVLLKGRDGIFSGGFDLKEMAKGPEQAILLTARGSKMARRILAFPTPVIAVSTGHCIAMGAFLMLACDYRIGTDGAFKTGLNETLIGMTMHNFGIELARYRIPANYFNRCVINAEIWTPTGAITAGFYDQIVPAEQLDQASQMAAKGFSQLNMTAFNGTKNKSRKAFLQLLDQCIESDLIIPDGLAI
ncbi:crotonase/enoyl-CoA hydratase family protein [Porticoccaceae bacterium]|jgi:enoyl-CoA hydratase|nr:crotonase/enoyl-CoA hydratase family protein [Porticoccaceae bacterium]|tara:strand:+ start:262 stop:963 length:702 start_codon:yes stop_codon:yes gene_type:complete